MRLNLPLIPELDYQIVMDSLKGYAYPRKALSDALARRELLRVKKGIYVQSGPGISPYSREILANMIYGPSYISFEYALSYHGLIPERVEEVASVTKGKTKSFTTPVGKFTYMHLSTNYYSFGFGQKQIEGGRAFLIADPEKAVADRVFREKGGFTLRGMKDFLFDGLRIDEAGFRNLDKSLFAEAAARSGRRSLALLLKVKDGFS
jgi:hypothetical protein